MRDRRERQSVIVPAGAGILATVLVIAAAVLAAMLVPS